MQAFSDDVKQGLRGVWRNLRSSSETMPWKNSIQFMGVLFGLFQRNIGIPWIKRLAQMEILLLLLLRKFNWNVQLFSYLHNFSFLSSVLQNWSIIDRLHLVRVPTFITNGCKDISQDFVVLPFNKIQKVKWVTFENSSHLQLLSSKRRIGTWN